MKINFFGDFVAQSNCKDLLIGIGVRALLEQADINIVNFEAPSLEKNSESVPIKKSGPALKQNHQAALWLENNGFTFASLANNHIMDYGDSGYKSTLHSFNRIRCWGAGSWEEAYKPCICTIGEKKVAFIALTHCEFGTLTDRWDDRFNRGTAWINHPNVDHIIIETRKSVDWLFVFAHAGVEHIQQPLPEWRDRYRTFIDLGCDGVIASHPHIMQGWEIYKGKPIVYSLGNFYFPKFYKKQESWYHSLCATITCTENEIHLDITPLVFDDCNIRTDTSTETSAYLKAVNEVLVNEQRYMQEINATCMKMLDSYYNMFEAGGLMRYNLYRLFKITARKILKKNTSNVTHLINNLRCESHRFCICRALKLENNIQ